MRENKLRLANEHSGLIILQNLRNFEIVNFEDFIYLLIYYNLIQDAFHFAIFEVYATSDVFCSIVQVLSVAYRNKY